MKNLKIMIILVMIFALFGCEDNQNSEPTGHGYVFEISEGRVLILDNVKESDFGNSWLDIYKGYTGSAIWLSTHTSKYKVGQKVSYWVDGGVDDSFPAQAGAKKIEIIKDIE